jgi:glucose/arabinose dehydrogenase/PKD repeat protein/type 1 glutamine amidotransferase
MKGNRSVFAAWCLPCALLAACATEPADQPAEPVSLHRVDQDSAEPAAGHGHHDDFRILVFTRTAGERHASIGAGARAIADLGHDNDFGVDVSADASKFTDRSLRRYRAVVFLNTTGDILDDGQQAAFERYMRGGGGFVGVHAAVETEPGWSFYTNLLGTAAVATSEIASATVKVADRVHPSSRAVPEYWTRTDQWYDFGSNVRGVSHVLATVDETTYTGGRMGFDHPIAWCKDFQGGRSWYTAGGHTSESYADRAFLRHLLGGIQWAAGRAAGDCGATVLANYQMTVIASNPENLGEPIGFAVLPDGRVLQTVRTGELRLHDPAAGTSTVINTIPVYTNSEDGLYGPSIDRQFATNRWVYLYYAPPLDTPAGNAPVTSPDPNAWDPFQGYFQLSRFKLVESPTPHLDLATEQQILRVPVVRGTCCHVAGEIRFDSKGNLWLVTGDDTNAGGSDGFTPINDMAPPESPVFQNPAYDARRSAGNTNDLRGKLLRIRVHEDGTYSIPHGNLFPPGTPKTRPEIYAMGLRNPFRLNLDGDDVPYITDYSPDSRVPSPTRGPEGTGRMMVVREPANYGWPFCAQPFLPYFAFDFATGISGAPFDCAAPVNDSRHNTGLRVLPPVHATDLWYTYNPLTPCPQAYLSDPPQACPDRFPELATGGVAGVGPHGAAPYHYDPGLDSPTKFPAYYDKSIFFGEFTRNYLKEIRLDSRGKIFKINSVLNCGEQPQPFLCDHPMDQMWGPDGNFYLLTYGDGFFRANPDAKLVKFSYVRGLRAPTAVLSVARTSGQAPLTVEFSSEGSNDPDPGDSFTFAWDFNGDGVTDSMEADPTFTYTVNGTFVARLTVTDSGGRTGTATRTITVGNTAPTVVVTVPSRGGFFQWGDRIPWTVTVSDPEDTAIDCTRVAATFVLGHDSHGHAGETQMGCSGVFQTDASDATHAGGFLFGAVSASYTDSGGLTSTDQTVIQQMRQQAEVLPTQGTTTAFSADSSGVQVVSIDPGDWISLDPVNFTNLNAITFRVSGGAAATVNTPRAIIELRLDAPDGTLVTAATVNDTGGANTFASQTTPIAAPGGTHRLYLVFQSVAGGPTADLFNLNWFELVGGGIAE